jgi:phosphoribosylglycinamide formyltransferase 1
LKVITEDRFIKNPRYVMVGSEGGSLLNAFLQKRLFNEDIVQVVSNSSCGFISVAKKWGLSAHISNKESISEYLIDSFGGSPEIYIINFSTILFSRPFVDTFAGKAYNCHPSVLPAFKGLKAIDDNFSSNTLFMGCSIHQIENVVDGGNCLIQAALPMNRIDPFKKKRNIIFEAQLLILIQFMRWCSNERIIISDGCATVSRASFETTNYSPNLDNDLFSFIQKQTIP